MRDSKKNFWAYLALILATIFWAGNLVVGRASHSFIPPFTLAFFRWTLVTILLLPFSLQNIRRHLSIIKQHWIKIILTGLCGITFFSPLVYLSLHYTTVINAGLISATSPAIIVIFALFLLREKLDGWKILGIVASILGVIFILAKGQLRVLLHLDLNIGDLIILVATIAWAIYSILLKKIPLLPPILLLFLTGLVGSCLLFPCYLFEHFYLQPIRFSFATINTILYTALFASLLGFSCWTTGIRRIGPAKAGYFLNLIPVFAALLAVIFICEKIHYYHILGALFVFAGIYLATKVSNN